MYKKTYSHEELSAYFDRIALPTGDRALDVSIYNPEQQLRYLALLQKHQLLTIPFENLDLHFSWHRTLHLGADHLFSKIICQRGRGGYCMENNSLFYFVLLSLGFDAYMVGARVAKTAASPFGALTHCLTIVRIGGASYGVDVCFGSQVPVTPFPLKEGLVQENLPPAEMRLRRDVIPGAMSGQKLWIYEQRVYEKADWEPLYCFADFEVLPPDLEVLNLGPSKMPSSCFTYKVMLVRFTAEEEVYSGRLDGVPRDDSELLSGVGRIDGQLILDENIMKWRKRGQKQWEIVLKNEAERVKALETWFNIRLSGEQRNAIVGTTAAI